MRPLVASFIICLLCIGYGYAQTIHGTFTDTLGIPISSVGVVLKSGDNIIIAYTSSNEKGAYSLVIPPNSNLQILKIEAGILGYKKQVKTLNEVNRSYDFSLSADIQALNTVIIRDTQPRLKIRGDTTNYRVADFSSAQDRVIGDVIRKLPGVDVDANGKISYNGKSISGFYIDGDNLLDDRYNIATTTVPNAVVENVQIIENHQPIKILRNKSFNENVALNIAFKKDTKLKLLGQATIGGGVPAKYDANVNGMTFKAGYKAINYVKANNIGMDVASDLISHNSSNYLKRTENNKPGAILSLGTAGTPDLPENRYLLNHGVLFNTNNLVNISKDVQIKANIAYLHDSQDQQYQKYEQTYILDNTIAYTELQNNSQRVNKLSSQVNMLINKEKHYLSNAFLGNLNNNTAYSMLTANSNNVQQNLKDNAADFSNELSYMKLLRNGLILNLYSYTNRISRPEIRIIAPGLNEGVFNAGTSYKQLEQQTNIPTWVTNNYISTRLALKGVSVQHKVGFSLQSQQLESGLFVMQNNDVINNALDSSSNNLNWLRKKFYTGVGIDILGTKIKFSMDLPVLLQQTTYTDYQYQLSQSLSRFYFNPLVQFKYQTGLENYISLNYNLMNNVGDINDVYRGYILKNYRTLYANDAGLTEQQNHGASAGFYYRKAIQLFFFNVNISYKRSNANNITSNLTTPDFQRRVILPFNNVTNSWGVTGTISKYLFFLPTTISASPTWQRNKTILIQNGILLPYQTQLLGLNVSLEAKLNKKVDVNYRNYVNYVKSFSLQTTTSNFSQVRQFAGINYMPLENLFIKLSGDYYLTYQPTVSNSSYFFADLKTQFNISRKKVSMELNALNLFNLTTYNTAYLSSNVFNSSTYKLPGRMIIGKVTFNY